MRAQCSLQFSDKELYENFVIPMKQSKELNTLIIKCLKAYYYDPQARDAIEGTDNTLNQPTDVDESAVSTQQDMINNIRQSLMMQSYMAQEMEDTLANGVDDISDILHNVNDVAESSGVANRRETENSSGILRITKAEDKPKPAQTATSQSVSQTMTEDSKLAVMMSVMLSMAEKLGDVKDIERLKGILNSSHPTDTASEQTVDNVSEQSNSQATNNMSEQSTSQTADNVSTDDEFFEEVKTEPTKVEEVEEKTEPEVVEDTDNLLGSLLSDLI